MAAASSTNSLSGIIDSIMSGLKTGGTGLTDMLSNLFGAQGALSLGGQNAMENIVQLLGLAANAYTAQQTANQQQQIFGQQENIASQADQPGAMGYLASLNTQPITNAQYQEAQNMVNPTLAARGLATSPGISQYITEQALAPWQEQNSQIGAAMTTQGLQYPFEVGSAAASRLPFLQANSFAPVGQSTTETVPAAGTGTGTGTGATGITPGQQTITTQTGYNTGSQQGQAPPLPQSVVGPSNPIT